MAFISLALSRHDYHLPPGVPLKVLAANSAHLRMLFFLSPVAYHLYPNPARPDMLAELAESGGHPLESLDNMLTTVHASDPTGSTSRSMTGAMILSAMASSRGAMIRGHEWVLPSDRPRPALS